VAIGKELQGFPRRHYRAVLLLRFLLEDAQRGEIVFHLLKGIQRGLAVARHRPPSKIVCAKELPTAHKKLCQPPKFRIELLSKPSKALSVTVGKYAALAMPICSFASATRRSAAAISGLRSKSSDGRPGGISGGWRSSGAGCKLN